MKKLLNTLFVTTPGTYLHRDGATVTAKQDEKVVLRLPIHTLESIICFGRVSASPPLLGLCCESGVHVSFVSDQGEFWGRVQGTVKGNVLLRRTQFRVADDAERSATIAQAMVMAKIANTRTVLLRAMREQAVRKGELEAAAEHLRQAGERMLRASYSLETLRGIEGECASCYFGVFGMLMNSVRTDLVFQGRTRRPPLDPVNALLSFVYTLLRLDVSAALESVGLDPYVGFLHTDRPGRPSLALDVMEEFRPVLADRLVLNLINRQQVSAGGFERAENGAVLMTDKTRRIVLQTWQQRKQEEVRHPFIGESAPLGLFPHLQALLLARHLRGDLDAYPALVWR